ncbi:hypothetical protein PtB15_6B376 [Puccinia triticina]|nr:hypothetical protein PtB15_6B376 [Puccinia triticina]
MQFTHSILAFALIGELVVLPIGASLSRSLIKATELTTPPPASPVDELLPAASKSDLAGPKPEVAPVFTPQATTPAWRPRQATSTPHASVGTTPTRTPATPGPSTPGRTLGSPDERYVLPYKITNNAFARDVEKMGFFKSGRLASIWDSDLKAVTLFKKRYSDSMTIDQQIRLVQEALDYLFKQRKISPKALEEWVKKFIEIGTKHESIISDFHSTLFYGLHTLRLKYDQIKKLRIVIHTHLNKAMKSFPMSFRQSAGTQWEKALFFPGNGKHKRVYAEWNKILSVGPATDRRMEKAILNPVKDQEDEGIKTLKYLIESRFSRAKMAKYTCQNRMTALALLHNYSKSAHVERQQSAVQIAWSLAREDEGKPLFHHEKVDMVMVNINTWHMNFIIKDISFLIIKGDLLNLYLCFK